MRVVTEAALRVMLKGADLDAMKEYRVESGVIVTPSARSWLIDKKIDLIIGSKRVVKTATSPSKIFSSEKPEYMTALRDTTLVSKDHAIIHLRGKLDSLMAKILEVQIAFERLGLSKGVSDLGETLELVRRIMRSEVLEETLAPIRLFGMDEATLRSHSHAPDQYYGIPHFFASTADGEAVILLNSLRTTSREVELAAYPAFKTECGEPERPDIIRALNRLSSAYYVMMLRAKTKEYSL